MHQHQSRAHPSAAAAADHAGRFHFYRLREVDLAGLQGGDEAHQQRGGEANAGAEREHAPIDFAGQVHLHAAARGEEQHQRVAAPVRDQEAAGGSEQGEHEAFGEELFPEARATGADG